MTMTRLNKPITATEIKWMMDVERLIWMYREYVYWQEVGEITGPMFKDLRREVLQ